MSTLTTQQNPFQQNLARLIERLGLLVAPKNPGSFWTPSDFESVGEHLKEACDLFDDFVEGIGFQVADNSYFTVDARDFADTCSNGACDAIYACTSIAERMRDERDAA